MGSSVHPSSVRPSFVCHPAYCSLTSVLDSASRNSTQGDWFGFGASGPFNALSTSSHDGDTSTTVALTMLQSHSQLLEMWKRYVTRFLRYIILLYCWMTHFTPTALLFHLRKLYNSFIILISFFNKLNLMCGYHTVGIKWCSSTLQV